MRNNASIAGRVVDAAGIPIPGVSVAISESTQPHNDLAALTNAEGRFRLGVLAPGSYTLAAHRAGHAVGGVRVVVTPGQQAEVEIRLHG
jgi:hypothetical protein